MVPAVDHMRLYIGDRFVEAEIREKEQARKEYEQAKQAGKKTSLVVDKRRIRRPAAALSVR